MDEVIQMFSKGMASGNWWLVFSAVLMVVSGIVNRLAGNKIPVKYMPYVSIGLGVLLSVAGSMAEGKGWLESISRGVMMGLAGSGMYSAAGKYTPLKTRMPLALEDVPKEVAKEEPKAEETKEEKKDE